MQEMLNEYIVEQALIVIPVLLVLGTFIKSTPKIKDWTIPYILLVLGVLFTVALMGFNVDAIIQGVLVSGAAVFSNQLYKQAKNKDVA
ncbi:phage holin family protein [Amphibacillus sp. MSJ-3]|uniref:phage holin family protein n=1 Tax=Amphibacillus sp. MSJ-3 TaxID=2841505 RepID=UPI001C0F113B|nr:phage holin family protein [Amphibacillus sp. MSJ-3]MBU5594927.1 phage holin family protein [Amphibacillus sp. MSJ-3]